MERTLSAEERIRRAEEIYYKRKMQNTNSKSARVNVSNKKDFGMFKKMILQIAICIVIYSIYYMIQNTNYIFSEGVIKKTNEILSYDINIKGLYEQTMQYLNQFTSDIKAVIPRSEDENTANPNDNNGNEEDSNNENINSEEESKIQEENIGGENIEENKDEEINLSQMEQDAKYILENKSLIIPLKGTITSRYGPRNPETPTVPKNHTGIDIAVNEGTVFNASMEGTVQEVSSKRRFRKSRKDYKW